MNEKNYEETYGKEPINDDIINAAIEKYMTSYDYIIPAKEADEIIRDARKSEELAYIDEIIQTCIKYKQMHFVLLNPSKDAIEILRDKGYEVREIESSSFAWDSFYSVSF